MDRSVEKAVTGVRHNALRSVTLRGVERQLQGKQLRALADALQLNTTLLSMNLSHTRLSDKAVAVLGEALKTNKTITAIKVKDCQLSSCALRSLAEAVAVNNALRVLSVARNPLALGHCGGDHDQHHPQIASAAALGEAILHSRSLTSLNIALCDLTASTLKPIALALAACKQQGTMPGITRLNLRHNHISDAGAIHIGTNLFTCCPN